MPFFYLDSWEWDSVNNRWQAPGGHASAVIDFRSLAQQSQTGGTPEGVGLFVYATAQSGLRLLGQALDDNLTVLQKAALRQLTGIGSGWSVPDKLGIALFAALLNQGDVTGEARFKPLILGASGGLTLTLGGQTVGSVAERLALTNTIEVFRADYRRLRLLVENAGYPLNALRRYTGWLMRRLRLAAADILPPEYEGDGSLDPDTSIGDTFNRANNTDLNAADTGKTLNGSASTWQWTETSGDFGVNGNALVNLVDSNDHDCRAEQDLSSDNHYSQADAGIDVTTSRYVGVAARFAPDAVTYYTGMHLNDTSDTYMVAKLVGGAFTALSTASGAAPGNSRVTDKLQVNGSNLEYFSGGVSRISIVDTAITGNLRCGVGYAEGNGSQRASYDNFIAEDLAPVSGSNIPVIMHHRQQQRVS